MLKSLFLKRKAAQWGIYSAFRLVFAILTVALVVGFQYLPKRELSLLHNPEYYVSLYSESAAHKNAEAYWKDRERRRWHCDHKVVPGDISCGMTLTLDANLVSGIDLSSYDGVRLDMWYEGDSKRLRIYMREQLDGVSVEGDANSLKFMSTIMSARAINDGTTFIPFNDFATAEWWAVRWNLSGEEAQVSVSDIVVIGIDLMDAGKHSIEVLDVVAVGEWLAPEVFYLTVLVIWLGIIIGEGVYRGYRLYIKSRASQNTINQLMDEQKILSEKAERDPLTQALNREGLSRYLQRLPSNCAIGVVLMDIDHFKSINDQFGHDMGDSVLTQFCMLARNMTRDNDAFVRWGGEEFLLVCQSISQRQLTQLAEKMRVVVEKYAFNTDAGLAVTVSMGLACGNISDIDGLVKLADGALYEAKQGGRNQVRLSNTS